MPGPVVTTSNKERTQKVRAAQLPPQWISPTPSLYRWSPREGPDFFKHSIELRTNREALSYQG